MRAHFRATFAIATMTALMVAVAGCEGSHLYSSARIGARLSTDGVVEFVVFSCPDSPVTKIEAVAEKLEAVTDLEQRWSAEPNQPSFGLVSVQSTGMPGWEVQGTIPPTSSERFVVTARFQGEGSQSLTFVPAVLARDVITVEPSSFGRKNHVTEFEFTQTNEKWCADNR